MQSAGRHRVVRRPVTVERTMYYHVVAALDSATCQEIKAIVRNPPDNEPYTILKLALIDAFGTSEIQRNMQLLSLGGLGDRRPTAFLRHIQSLHTDADTLLRALFLSHLPLDVRQVIATSTAPISGLAKEADRVMDAKSNGYAALHLASASTASTFADQSLDMDPPQQDGAQLDARQHNR